MAFIIVILTIALVMAALPFVLLILQGLFVAFFSVPIIAVKKIFGMKS